MPRDSNAGPRGRGHPGQPPAPRPPERSGAAVAAAIAAACLVCAPLTGKFEGFVPRAKPDPIGINTGCFGERVDQSDLDPSRIYTRSECTDRLRRRQAHEYAPRIATCLPQLTAPDRRNEFVAMVDSSYNAGWAAVCSSPMAASIKADDWPAACAAVRTFRVGSVTARPVKGALDSRLIASGPNKGKYFNRFRGLIRRRAFFADFCMSPEPPPRRIAAKPEAAMMPAPEQQRPPLIPRSSPSLLDRIEQIGGRLFGAGR